MILIAAAYANSIQAPFVYDDKIEVIGNRTIRLLDKWQEIVLYNPARLLLQLSYALNFYRGGFDPESYHLTNVLIHSACAASCLFSVERIARLSHPENDRTPLLLACAVSLIWILHPMATESVTYITGRSESLCALFSLLSLGCWAQHLRTPNWFWWFCSFVAILCAGLSKEVGLIVPFVLLLMSYFLTPSIRWRDFFPFVFLLVGGIALRAFIVSSELENPAIASVLINILPQEVERSSVVQLFTQLEVWLRYAWLWVAPYPQTIYHHIPDAIPVSGRSLVVVLAWLGVLAVAQKATLNRPLARFAFFSALLILLPSSIAPLKENMAEHRSHQFGFFLWFGLIVIGQRWITPKRLLPIALLLTVATHVRNRVWTSEILIWTEAAERSPDVAEAWYGLGDSYRFAKQLEPAISAFQRCTELDPSYLDCWNNLGICYAEMGDVRNAEAMWKESLVRDTSYCKAHTNLGFLALRTQRWDEALVELKTAAVYCPTNIIAHYGLGTIYYGPRRNRQKAIHHFDIVLQLDPTFDYAEEVREKLLELTW